MPWLELKSMAAYSWRNFWDSMNQGRASACGGSPLCVQGMIRDDGLHEGRTAPGYLHHSLPWWRIGHGRAQSIGYVWWKWFRLSLDGPDDEEVFHIISITYCCHHHLRLHNPPCTEQRTALMVMSTLSLIMGFVNRGNPALVRAPVSGGRLEEGQISWLSQFCLQIQTSTQRTVVELSFGTLVSIFWSWIFVCGWLMAGTCASYDDAQIISCEHGEGGQNVSLSMLLFFS